MIKELSFKLDAFEGPLDLLLHLVSKHKLNIYDIEISLLLEQYLAYIDGIEDMDYEAAADFLEMAARLIYIKTCYLLPQPEEAEELKKELQGRMIEYSLCKLAAARLKEAYAGGLVFVREPVKLPVNKQYTRLHDKQELYDAYMGIASKVKNYTPLRANMFSPIVSRRVVSVESKITYVLQRLYSAGHFDMRTLYEGMTDRSEQIATFLAVLELTKSGRVWLNDDNTRIELRHPEGSAEQDEISEPEETAEPEEVPEPEETAEPEEVTEPEEIPELEETAEPEESPEQEQVPEPEESPEPEETAEPEEVPEPEKVTEPEETAEPEQAPEQEESPEPDVDKPAKVYTMQLALRNIRTAALRTGPDEPEPAQEVPAVAAFAPAVLSEPEVPEQSDRSETDAAPDSLPEQSVTAVTEVTEEKPLQSALPAADVPDVQQSITPAEDAAEEDTEEAPVTAVKANYFGRRYYWGLAPLACRPYDFAAAWRLRI